jgi:hypothetical protein
LKSLDDWPSIQKNLPILLKGELRTLLQLHLENIFLI